MKNSAELLNALEERFTGWSYDTRTLLYCLSRISELPKNIENDARVMSQMVIKCETLSIYRIALHQLTLREHRLNVQPAGDKAPQSVSLTPQAGNDAAAITGLIAEIKRLENELSSTPVDYVGILRFIREKLK